MSNFSATLQEYQLGVKDLEAVETQIEHELIRELIPAEELVRRLDAQHAIRNFEPEERRTIERCIWTIETKRRTEFERNPTGGELFLTGDADPLSTTSGEEASGQEGEAASEADQATDLPSSIEEQSTGQQPEVVPQEDSTRLAPKEFSLGEGVVLGGRYRLEKLIGRGGMSEVYLAVDQKDEKFQDRDPHLAVKVMTVNARNQQDAKLAMQREVARSRRLTHENILRVHHFDEDGATAFMTMELLKGESLLQRLSSSTRGGLPAPEAERIILQVAAALEHAHEKGIVHADLKPSNVFLDDKDQVKVIDFGIARALSSPTDAAGDKTVFDPRRLGAMTVAYASPEMIEAAEADPRDDIYSLGCLAYEAYTGKHPFARAQSTDVRDSGFAIERPKQIPAPQWAAIRHALAFEQANRTASARAFMEEFAVAEKPPIALIAGGAVVAAAVLAALLIGFGGSDDAAPENPSATEVVTPAEPQEPIVAPVEVPGTAAFRDCPGCPALVAISSGSGYVGEQDAAAYPFDAPRHRVYIGAAVAMGQTEVTRDEFAEFVRDTGHQAASCRSPQSGWATDTSLDWRSPGYTQSGSHPVTCVSFLDATAYVRWLSERAGFPYRLPSEAEWEYSARLQVPEVADCQHANLADGALAGAYEGLTTLSCNDGFVHTAPAATFSAGASNVPQDMRGNVFEWTGDCWTENYLGAPTDGSPNLAGDCSARVLRGGSWFTAPGELRLAYRNRAPQDHRSNTFGFRVARDLTE